MQRQLPVALARHYPDTDVWDTRRRTAPTLVLLTVADRA
jgi:hypothetical protein